MKTEIEHYADPSSINRSHHFWNSTYVYKSAHWPSVHGATTSAAIGSVNSACHAKSSII